MNRDAFMSLQAQLREAGLPVGGARYDEEVFGSWWITLLTNPPICIVWDGKEGWLIVQRATSRRFRWFLRRQVWEDVWIGKDEETRRPEAALAQVLRVLGRRS